MSENIFFVASCIFISCNGKHFISIFLESRWETNIFPQRFRKHKNQMQTYISYYLMLRYASVSIVNENNFETIAKSFHSCHFFKRVNSSESLVNTFDPCWYPVYWKLSLAGLTKFKDFLELKMKGLPQIVLFNSCLSTQSFFIPIKGAFKNWTILFSRTNTTTFYIYETKNKRLTGIASGAINIKWQK